MINFDITINIGLNMHSVPVIWVRFDFYPCKKEKIKNILANFFCFFVLKTSFDQNLSNMPNNIQMHNFYTDWYKY